MPRSHRGTTTQAGYGYDHRQTKAGLLARHRDGQRCPCTCPPSSRCPCRRAGLAVGAGLPMYRDPSSNVDELPLHADHSRPRILGGDRADRLILGTCNLILGAILGNQLRSRRRGRPPRPVPPAPPTW